MSMLFTTHVLTYKWWKEDRAEYVVLKALNAIPNRQVYICFYAPNFEKVEGAFCFGLVRASVRYNFEIWFWNFIDGLSIKK